jgi:hypothetical protein
MPLGVFVGSDQERYLRVLQILGLVRLYPWSIRGFSPAEVDRLRPSSEAHPWGEDAGFERPARSTGAQEEILPASITTRYNTAFPFGMNDGAVWAGRGFTGAAEGGAAVRQGPLSIVVAPIAFWAENRSFVLRPNGQQGILRFADPTLPLYVDRPQRFGERAYARFDFGQTTIRVDAFGVAIGLSAANQGWGPMTELPFLLGNNAPGFPHGFVGTARPVNVWAGRLHFRAMYGGLTPSPYNDLTGWQRGRLASGVIALFVPRGLPQLELGAARFFHTIWPDSGFGSRQLRKPFESLLKLALPAAQQVNSSENQLASAFGRWVMPRSGFEIYGEYGRDDHNGNSRDLLQEPDHIATYGLGLQKARLAPSGRSVLVLRGELINFEVSTLQRNRPEGAVYGHTGLRGGHTQRGQLLGAGFAVNSGAGATIALERFTRRGAESIGLSRLVRQELDNPELSTADPPTTRCSDTCVDVQYVLRADRLRRYDRFELRYGLAVVYELNRDFRRDAMNWNPEIELRWRP